MTYEEACDFLFHRLPMFQRDGAAAYKPDLRATLHLLACAGNPLIGEDGSELPVVHVAGTNGKGSVCHLVAASLTASGRRTGLFTSPHLQDFRERIRVDGQQIPEEAVVEFLEQHFACAENGPRPPSFFEWTFALAMWWFRKAGVEMAVLETGMGGRLDSTNVVRGPWVTAITNVGLDHQQFLGPDVRTIAGEKAGILKDGRPVVVGRMRPEALSVVLEHALRTGSEVHYAETAAEPRLPDEARTKQKTEPPPARSSKSSRPSPNGTAVGPVRSRPPPCQRPATSGGGSGCRIHGPAPACSQIAHTTWTGWPHFLATCPRRPPCTSSSGRCRTRTSAECFHCCPRQPAFTSVRRTFRGPCLRRNWPARQKSKDSKAPHTVPSRRPMQRPGRRHKPGRLC